MKLRERFLNTNEDICEIIADEFAVSFAEWLVYQSTIHHTIKQLLEIYKQENDL